jgi:hypothetical protein
MAKHLSIGTMTIKMMTMTIAMVSVVEMLLMEKKNILDAIV